jgi:hypothetical protein
MINIYYVKHKITNYNVVRFILKTNIRMGCNGLRLNASKIIDQ